MDNQTYRLVFDGKIADNADIDAVKKKIAVLFRKKEEDIEKLFSGQKVVIKRNTTHEMAEKIRNIFLKAGAICLIQPEKGHSAVNISNFSTKPKIKPPPVPKKPDNVPTTSNLNQQTQSKKKPAVEPQSTLKRKSSGSISIFMVGILVGTPLVFIAGLILQRIVGITIGVPLACIFFSWWICDRIVTGRAKHMVPAFSLLAGKGMWSFLAVMFTGNYMGLFDLVILAAGLIWLLKRPGLGPVIYLATLQVLNFCYILFSSGSALGTHLIIAGISIYLLFDGHHKLKTNYSVQNDKTSMEKIKRMLIQPKNIVGVIFILILIKIIGEMITH